MFPRIWFLIFVVLIAQAACTRDDPRIALIDKEVKAIDGMKGKMAMEEVGLEGYSLEGGMAKVYRDKDNIIRLLEVEQHGEVALWTESIYFKDGKMIYIYSRDYGLNASQNVTGDMAGQPATETQAPEKSGVAENWYYFSEGLLIHWIDNDRNPVDPKSEEFIMAESDYRDYMEQLLGDISHQQQ